MFRNRRLLLGLLIVLALTLSLTGIAGAEDATPPEPVEQPTDEAPIEESTPPPADPTPTEEAPEPPTIEEVPILAALDASFGIMGVEGNGGQSGTTLQDAAKTATAYWEREFEWTIEKSVDPASWDLFTGDSGTSTYTIEVTKDAGTDTYWVAGEICVTNGGEFATEDLSIVDNLQYKSGAGQFATFESSVVDVSSNPVLDPGEEGCYDYNIPFTAQGSGDYRNEAVIEISNHAGDNTTGTQVREPFTLPAAPTLINDEINVDDTNGGSWLFDDDGSVDYDVTFTCDDEGNNDNTATIRETGDDDDARVVVACYELEVTKDADTSFDRTYHWSIDKSADQSSLTLALNQSYLVNYAVEVDMTGYDDSNWAVAGDIDVYNPAPMAATINGVADVISTAVTATVDCGVTFPYTLASEDTLSCTYAAELPDATTRTNTATATLQNYDYDPDGVGTESGTTDFDGTAQVSFAGAEIAEIGECITVVDSHFVDPLGVVCYGVDELPKTFTYSWTVGPYDTCGDYEVENTAAFATLEDEDLQESGSDSWTVDINVPCGGCTLTIGYWKNHAGFGPQADMVSEHLPIWLGTLVISTPEQATSILGFNGSDGVFAPSNGVNKLYAQLLAAKLNISNGADGSAVATTISQANTWLLTHNSTSWASLSKNDQKKVLNWAFSLDSFNNGLIGPGHCSE